MKQIFRFIAAIAALNLEDHGPPGGRLVWVKFGEALACHDMMRAD